MSHSLGRVGWGGVVPDSTAHLRMVPGESPVRTQGKPVPKPGGGGDTLMNCLLMGFTERPQLTTGRCMDEKDHGICMQC